MIINQGITKMLTKIKETVVNGVVSTDSTPIDENDTTVPDEVTDTNKSVEDSIIGTNTLTFQHRVLSTEGNGSTFRKELIKDSDDELVIEDSHPDLVKTSSDEIVYFHRITLQRE